MSQLVFLDYTFHLSKIKFEYFYLEQLNLIIQVTVIVIINVILNHLDW